MGLDRIKYKVEKVENIEKSSLSLKEQVESLSRLLAQLPTIEQKDMDIAYVQHEEKDEGTKIVFDHDSSKEESFLNKQNTGEKSLFEQFREFLDEIRNKYGLNYLAKMSKDEEEKYVALYSKSYNVPEQQVRNEIESAINDMYDKKVNSIQKESIVNLQSQVDRMKADIQEYLIKSNNLDEVTMIREQLENIMTLPSDNEKDLNSKIKYLSIIKEKIGNVVEQLSSQEIGVGLVEQFVDFAKMLNNKYGEKYLAFMTKEEEEKYIALYSQAYNVTEQFVREKIEFAISDMYEKRVNGAKEEKIDTCSLDDIMPLLQEEGYTILGHGTGYGNVDSVKPIFDNGLRASHNSVFYTTIGLDIPNKEVLHEKLNNWPHKDSENVVLIKLPNAYFNMYGENGDLNCEKTGAFVNEVVQDNGNVNYYLDSKFIIGSYNRKTDSVTLNPKFEKVYSPETIKKMEEKLNEAKEKTRRRNEGLNAQLEDMKPFDEVIATGYPDFQEFEFPLESFDEFNGPKL